MRLIIFSFFQCWDVRQPFTTELHPWSQKINCNNILFNQEIRNSISYMILYSPPPFFFTEFSVPTRVSGFTPPLEWLTCAFNSHELPSGCWVRCARRKCSLGLVDPSQVLTSADSTKMDAQWPVFLSPERLGSQRKRHSLGLCFSCSPVSRGT